MKWINNLINLNKTGLVGKCPYCGKENTRSRFQKVDGDMGVGDIWCEDCKKAFHISRINMSELNEELIKNNSIKPKTLEY